jgi:hypothetical protein
MPDVKKVMERRTTAAYMLDQYHSLAKAEYFQDHRDRVEKVKRLARGDWADLYASGENMPGDPKIENTVEKGINDISSLGADANASSNFLPRGDKVSDQREALVRSAIADTIYEMGGGKKIKRKLYMDLIEAGIMAVACTYSDKSEYPVFTRLDPENCYPDVRNGFLEDMFYIETIKLRQAQRMYPDQLGQPDAADDAECVLVDYYDDKECIKGVILKGKTEAGDEIREIKRWEHKLGCTPVAFYQLDTADGAFRGLFDQANGPLLARNKIVQLLIDYLEEMVHAPWEQKNMVLGPNEAKPGPDTVYVHEGDATESFARRTPPAAPAAAVFGLEQILQNSIQGETVQPPARAGQIPQSQASATFVQSTQGRLTTTIKTIQDGMADLRVQMNTYGMKIDEKWLDSPKPLIRPVQNKRMYTPSKDIDGWYYHTVTFGVGAGIDRMTADQRLLQFLGAKAISLDEVRSQLDFLTDPSSEQEKIDRWQTADVLFQRLATDPATPVALLAQINIAQSNGKSFIEAIEEVQPQLIQLQQQQAAAAAPPGPAGLPGPEAGATPPEDIAASVAAGGQGGAPGTGVTPEVAPYPIEQIIAKPRQGG